MKRFFSPLLVLLLALTGCSAQVGQDASLATGPGGSTTVQAPEDSSGGGISADAAASPGGVSGDTAAHSQDGIRPKGDSVHLETPPDVLWRLLYGPDLAQSLFLKSAPAGLPLSPDGVLNLTLLPQFADVRERSEEPSWRPDLVGTLRLVFVSSVDTSDSYLQCDLPLEKEEAKLGRNVTLKVPLGRLTVYRYEEDTEPTKDCQDGWVSVSDKGAILLRLGVFDLYPTFDLPEVQERVIAPPIRKHPRYTR